MNNDVEWLLVSLGVMVVAAVLGDLLNEKLQGLEKRLDRLERRGRPDDSNVPADAASTEGGASRHDHRA
ncbi:MAG TPA: hypothetical protein VMS64_14905 [Candidatus Methylomirabilis sp.]|nr:hypothetical protein [Candidatus Methylomirabilis sp.]